jgi:hypothetical protein
MVPRQLTGEIIGDLEAEEADILRYFREPMSWQWPAVGAVEEIVIMVIVVPQIMVALVVAGLELVDMHLIPVMLE